MGDIGKSNGTFPTGSEGNGFMPVSDLWVIVPGTRSIARLREDSPFGAADDGFDIGKLGIVYISIFIV